MHWLDSTIVALLAAAAVLGAWSGLLMQVFRLVGFGAALYLAVTLHPATTGWLQQICLKDGDPRVTSAVVFGGLFLGIYLTIFLATLMLEHGVKAAHLQYLNRGLGSVLAVGKMALLLGAICFACQRWPHASARQMLDESAMAPLLAQGVEMTIAVLPQEYREHLSNGWLTAGRDHAGVPRRLRWTPPTP